MWGKPGFMPSAGQYCYESPQVRRHAEHELMSMSPLVFVPWVVLVRWDFNLATALLHASRADRGLHQIASYCVAWQEKHACMHKCD